MIPKYDPFRIEERLRALPEIWNPRFSAPYNEAGRKLLREVLGAGSGGLFLNPRKQARSWQIGLDLVGKGFLLYDGTTFFGKDGE